MRDASVGVSVTRYDNPSAKHGKEGGQISRQNDLNTTRSSVFKVSFAIALPTPREPCG